MRKLVIGDIHGCYEEFLQVLLKCRFDTEKDTLISLGDLVDRGPDSFKVVDFIMKLPNKICIRGNHDKVWEEYLETGVHPWNFMQGSQETLDSYNREKKHNKELLEQHLEFFQSQLNYYLDENGNLFVHGGLNRHTRLKCQTDHMFYWDRDFFIQALSSGLLINNMFNNEFKIKEPTVKRVFLGHTPTVAFNIPDNDKPIFAAKGKVINLDTGCCFGNKLSIMDIDTLEYWQSDKK
jgi:serine/threonine protein phosphatase 1